MAIRLVTPPASEPVTVEDAHAHLQIPDADTQHDAWLEARIPGIRIQAEAATRRGFIEQGWRKTLDSFPRGAIELLPCRVSAVTAVEYTDGAGDTVALVEDTDYQVDLESEPARVLPVTGGSWPIAGNGYANAVVVDFTVGYGDAAADVPEGIKTWILERLATLFAFREQVTEDGKAVPPPDYEALDPYRVVAL